MHGGLRYLEHGDVRLVRESLVERERLLRTAPHLVRPLHLVIPVRRGSPFGTARLRAGMLAYDLLSTGKSLDRHRMLGRTAAAAFEPGIALHGLRGAAVYADAQVALVERLCVELTLDAMAHGAVCLNHTRVTGLLRDGARVVGVACVDALDGRTRTLRAPVVANMAGPGWTPSAGSATQGWSAASAAPAAATSCCRCGTGRRARRCTWRPAATAGPSRSAAGAAGCWWARPTSRSPATRARCRWSRGRSTTCWRR